VRCLKLSSSWEVCGVRHVVVGALAPEKKLESNDGVERRSSGRRGEEDTGFVNLEQNKWAHERHPFLSRSIDLEVSNNNPGEHETATGEYLSSKKGPFKSSSIASLFNIRAQSWNCR